MIALAASGVIDNTGANITVTFDAIVSVDDLSNVSVISNGVSLIITAITKPSSYVAKFRVTSRINMGARVSISSSIAVAFNISTHNLLTNNSLYRGITDLDNVPFTQARLALLRKSLNLGCLTSDQVLSYFKLLTPLNSTADAGLVKSKIAVIRQLAALDALNTCLPEELVSSSSESIDSQSSASTNSSSSISSPSSNESGSSASSVSSSSSSTSKSSSSSTRSTNTSLTSNSSLSTSSSSISNTSSSTSSKSSSSSSRSTASSSSSSITSLSTSSSTEASIITWDPAFIASDPGTTLSLSNHNLNVTHALGSPNNYMVRATKAQNAGKWFFEMSYLSDAGGSLPLDILVGIVQAGDAPQGFIGELSGASSGYGYEEQGSTRHDATTTPYGSAFSPGDTIGIAYDGDNHEISFYLNGVTYGIAYTGISSAPWYPAFSSGNASGGPQMISANFGATPFTFAAPTGFAPWNDNPYSSSSSSTTQSSRTPSSNSSSSSTSGNKPVDQLYSAAGKFTYVVPTGVTRLFVSMLGAGGGGGNNAYNGSDGKGAGDGASASRTVTVVPGETIYIQVGNYGVGGTASGAFGSHGSNDAPGTIGYGGKGGNISSNPSFSGGGGQSTYISRTSYADTGGTILLLCGGGGGGGGGGKPSDHGAPGGCGGSTVNGTDESETPQDAFGGAGGAGATDSGGTNGTVGLSPVSIYNPFSFSASPYAAPTPDSSNGQGGTTGLNGKPGLVHLQHSFNSSSSSSNTGSSSSSSSRTFSSSSTSTSSRTLSSSSSSSSSRTPSSSSTSSTSSSSNSKSSVSTSSSSTSSTSSSS